jgi:hypothetical protein
MAIAVPLTRGQFISDLARPDLKDYATHVRRANHLDGASEEYYSDLFERSAKVARRVCDEVEAMGVTVRRAAKPHDLTDLLQNFKVVTLVTHWRFTRLLPEDIIDVHGLLHALAVPEGHVQEAVRRAILARGPELLDEEMVFNAQTADLRERLASTLSAIAAASHALYGATSDDLPSAGNGASPNTIERLTRSDLEQAFPGLIAFGRSVEFSDGMRSIQEVVEAVPNGFNGMLDLTTCNSVILGKAIKARHPYCLVAMNRYATALHVRMAIYKLVIEDLARRASPFADALSRFHKD